MHRQSKHTSPDRRGKRHREDLLLQLQEEVFSDDSENEQSFREDSDEDHDEPLEQKRIRLAKEYLRSLAPSDPLDSNDADGENHQLQSDRLSRTRLDSQGRLFRNLATNVADGTNDMDVSQLSGHKGPVTSVACSSDSTQIFSGSKDNAVIRWDTETSAKTFLKNTWKRDSLSSDQCHHGEILAVACSSDSKYVACGGRDKCVRIYDQRQQDAIKVFQGHRGAVTSLAFRKDSLTLYSGSDDRSMKQWDLNEMGYLETLFGHQEPINAIDCWMKEQPVSVSSDRSMRIFKIAQESHLVFRGHTSSVDCIQILTDTSVVSGGQDGSICLWKETAKKPVAVARCAHGSERSNTRWLVSLASLKMSDLVVSGSHDGFVRIWQANADAAQLQELASIPMGGFVNSLAITPRIIVAGCGNEHRLGRWWREKGSHNKVRILRLPNYSEHTS